MDFFLHENHKKGGNIEMYCYLLYTNNTQINSMLSNNYKPYHKQKQHS